jgi:hypothetical protein
MLMVEKASASTTDLIWSGFLTIMDDDYRSKVT